MRRSNQLSSYEATDVGSWSFVGSNFYVGSNPQMTSSQRHRYHEVTGMNGMIYEMNHILNCGYGIK